MTLLCTVRSLARFRLEPPSKIGRAGRRDNDADRRIRAGGARSPGAAAPPPIVAGRRPGYFSPMLLCPICREPLRLDGATYRCSADHAFDRAREGYVDLLPAGHGRSGLTGDTRDMARARARFLDRGHYDPLMRRVADRAAAHAHSLGDPDAPDAPAAAGPVVAEAGCGTGHYVAAAGAAVRAAVPGAPAFGFDVSREALRVAGRRHPGVTFARSDIHHGLPLPDATVAVLLDIFAPRNPMEFRRVLRPDGLLLLVVPGDAHLRALRGALDLLDIEPEKRERTLERLAPAFRLVWEEPLGWSARLEPDDIVDLVGMTPSAFHVDPGEIRADGPMDATFDFLVLGLSPL